MCQLSKLLLLLTVCQLPMSLCMHNIVTCSVAPGTTTLRPRTIAECFSTRRAQIDQCSPVSARFGMVWLVEELDFGRCGGAVDGVKRTIFGRLLAGCGADFRRTAAQQCQTAGQWTFDENGHKRVVGKPVGRKKTRRCLIRIRNRITAGKEQGLFLFC